MTTAFINNVSFPKTLDQFCDFVFTDGKCCDVETLTENVGDSSHKWTCLKTADIGDICFFYHAKTANTTARRLEIEYQKNAASFTTKERMALESAFDRARNLYYSYGGKIFALAYVSSVPERISISENLHFSSKYFANYDDLHILNNPLSLESFSNFIRIARQASITRLTLSDFKHLEALIADSNDEYLIDGETSIIEIPALESVVVSHGPDGKKRQYYTTRYERNQKNRLMAINHHKKTYGSLSCYVCKFDYEKVYGVRGRDFIEVHHIKPLSMRNEEVTIIPEADLVCLCANCHRMIHRPSGILTPDELKQIVNCNTPE